jgi:hypothetical protein
MDARRYDKNADKLSQVLWHVNKINTKGNALAEMKKGILLHVLEDALQLNDDLGQMAEKGLI